MENSPAGCGVRLSVSVFGVFRCVAESSAARVLRRDRVRGLLRVVKEQLGETAASLSVAGIPSTVVFGVRVPLLRMLRVVRWKSVLAIAAFLASWTTALLLPNPLMPATVARSHSVETHAFNLMFGALAAWIMGQTGLRTQSSQSFSQP